jgi:CheY-like chemotaxis protein
MLHALVIEDHPMVSELIAEELYDLGYATVEIAAGERQAIEAAERHSPDLIISDDKIIGGSGVTAVHEICRERVIAVVFVVGDPDSVQTKLPFATVLGKPFRSSQLKDAIGEAALLAREYSGTLNVDWQSGMTASLPM